MVLAAVFHGRAVKFTIEHSIALRYRVRDHNTRVGVGLAGARRYHNTSTGFFLRLIWEEHTALRGVDPIVDLDEDVVGHRLQGSSDGGVI